MSRLLDDMERFLFFRRVAVAIESVVGEARGEVSWTIGVDSPEAEAPAAGANGDVGVGSDELFAESIISLQQL